MKNDLDLLGVENGCDIFSVILEVRMLGFDFCYKIIWVEQIIASCQLGWKELQFR